jgi:hypothetical protein
MILPVYLVSRQSGCADADDSRDALNIRADYTQVFVILSETKDLIPAHVEILRFAQNDEGRVSE